MRRRRRQITPTLNQAVGVSRRLAGRNSSALHCLCMQRRCEWLCAVAVCELYGALRQLAQSAAALAAP